MLLNTLNKEKLYEALAEVFSISVHQMKEYIKTNTKNILDYGYEEYTVGKIDITSLLSEILWEN